MQVCEFLTNEKNNNNNKQTLLTMKWQAFTFKNMAQLRLQPSWGPKRLHKYNVFSDIGCVICN